MAPSRLSNGWLLLALAGLLPALAAAAADTAKPAGEREKCTEDIEVKADSFDADYRTNTTRLRNVVISQCDIRVEAQRATATGLSFDNTRWVFDGNVRIDVEKRGSLRSSQAIVDFQNNQIAKATITGSPAQFEQRRSDNEAVARGHAGEIVYEVGPGTVQLANDAWLEYGTTEMKGSSLVYDIRQEKVRGISQPGEDGRVHIRITPTKPGSPKPKAPGSSGADSPPGPSKMPRAP